jgi:NAD(P)-dependent dehydrogenase (short-subunit alcohol dehydrogenase family)
LAKHGNKVAIVTGAARGIGAGVAAALAKKGYSVALIGLEGDLLRQNTKAIGDKAIAFEADMTDRVAVGSAFEGTRERFGRIDVVVSNAGISNGELVRNMSAENFARVIAVNLGGTFNSAKAALPHLIESKGYFLAVASIAAMSAPPGLAAYGASKAGTEAFCDTMRSELSHLGVDVGVAYFGWLATDLVKDASEHPAFTYMRTHLPGPLKTISPPNLAVNAIVSGVARRKRRVMAPGWIRLGLALRYFIAGDPSRYRKLMPEIERLFAEESKRRAPFISDPARR